MICVYGVATFFVHQGRFITNAMRILEDTSDRIR
jgi:hypothetical protein